MLRPFLPALCHGDGDGDDDGDGGGSWLELPAWGWGEKNLHCSGWDLGGDWEGPGASQGTTELQVSAHQKRLEASAMGTYKPWCMMCLPPHSLFGLKYY